MAEPTRPDADTTPAELERDRALQALWECRRRSAALAIERQHLQDAADAAREREAENARRAWETRLHQMEAERDRARGERDGLLVERDAARAERDGARAAAHDATALLGRITASTAWRVTAPARHALEWLRRPR